MTRLANTRALRLVPMAALLASMTAHAADAAACRAESGPTAVPVVELYTSEGCSSCPPADRWLSTLKRDPKTVALAFHVDYWDRLGWKDRFASPAWSERQVAQGRVNGARFAYTPQVVVDGRDRPDWPRADAAFAKRPPAAVTIDLAREGSRVAASIAAGPGAPPRLAAYWALTEQSHVSVVKAGENDGATLRHDYVVRDLKPVAAWASASPAPRLVYEIAAADPAHPREVNLVVVDADTGRPLQALKLGC